MALKIMRHIEIMLHRLLLISLLSTSAAGAANPAREQVVASELIERIGEQEVVWLQSNGSDFLALSAKTPATKERGGVILLHDIDAHPDWPEIISPLRNGLPEKGWSTLSIQLPLRSRDVELNARNQQKIIDQAQARITAAVEYFTHAGIYNIAFIGHGLGAAAISRFLSNDLPLHHAVYIKAFIAIRFRAHEQLPRAYSPRALLQSSVPLPIFELLGTRESPTVQQQAEQRKTVATQTQHPHFRQTILNSANNNFWRADALLLSRVSGWLKLNVADGVVVLVPLEQ